MLWLPKCLAFAVCQQNYVLKFSEVTHVLCWKGYFHTTCTHKWKADAVIGVAKLAIMIKFGCDFYLMTINYPMALASEPAHYSCWR